MHACHTALAQVASDLMIQAIYLLVKMDNFGSSYPREAERWVGIHLRLPYPASRMAPLAMRCLRLMEDPSTLP